MSTSDYVVLWSPHQKKVHVETVERMMKRNEMIFIKQQLGDYIVLRFEKTRDDAWRHAKAYRKWIDEKNKGDA